MNEKFGKIKLQISFPFNIPTFPCSKKKVVKCTFDKYYLYVRCMKILRKTEDVARAQKLENQEN